MITNDAIIVKGLRKFFGKVSVLNGIDLVVKRGTILALLGPNGAGKTTTIRILSTLLSPDAGQILVNGHDVVSQADLVRSSIGLTGQYAAVDEYLTGRENLIMMGRLYHLRKEDVLRRTIELLKEFDLVDAADRAVKTYSGGMRRRLDLAISLIAFPPILFLDEPTTGLDPRSRLNMWDNVKKLAAHGTTILLTTQYMEEADKLANRIAVIDGGKVIAEGTSDELKQKVGSERLELTLKNTNDMTKATQALAKESPRVDPSKRSLVMATQGGVHHLKQVLGQLDKANVEVENVSLHKPTLDDVFLSLTGKSTQAEENSK